MYEYVRRPGGLGASRNSHEYVPRPGGLGSLGFDFNWHIPMSNEVARSVPCEGGGTIVCARPEEQNYMVNQSCRVSYPEQGGGTGACTTGAGNRGNTWCCPPGRPGTSTSPTIAQQSVSRDQIRQMQTWLAQQGCSVGSTGADGVWGPNTRGGVECAVGQTSWTNVAGRFPFLSTLMADPTGTARPSGMIFDPGPGGGKTPEQGGVRYASGGAAPGGAPGAAPGTPGVQQAGILPGGMPWWGWLALLGGVGVLAFGGLYLYRKGEEEEAELEEAELAALGY